MIDSIKRAAHIIRKQADGSWKFEDIDENAVHLFIQTINLHLSLNEIYSGTGL
jgi:hypothetical protein